MFEFDEGRQKVSASIEIQRISMARQSRSAVDYRIKMY
jgi:hypothetical protein